MAVCCADCSKKKPFLFGRTFRTWQDRVYCETCLEQAKREAFCRELKPFTDAGLVKEVYYNQYYSICNLANAAYGLMFYGESPIGVVLLNATQVDYVALSMNNTLEVCRKHTRSDKACVTLSEEFAERLKVLKADTDVRGPSANIDAQTEEYWSQRRGERIREYEPPAADLG